MSKKPKTYEVNFDMIWSHDVRVRATGKTEAKQKAFEIFLKRLKRSDFRIDAEDVEKLY